MGLKEIVQKIIPTLSFKFPYDIDDYINNLYIENYHCHKMESNVLQTDCAESIENYARKTLGYKGKCLFTGEHGWQGNAFLTYDTCQEYKLKYRHSVEAYWVKNRHEKDRTNCHIILVAKNDEGRKDINYILSLANEENDGSYYYKPRIDLELLLSIPKDNIIVTSACVAGWKYEYAEEIWLKIYNHFRNNFFLEVQNHDTESQRELNKKILKIAKENNIQIICGLDSHYVDDKNRVRRDQVLKYKKIFYEDEQGWYLDFPNGKEALRRFQKQGILSLEESLRAIMNTNIFVNECEEIIYDTHFKIPCVYPNTTYEDRCNIYKNILKEQYLKEKSKSKEKSKGIMWEAKQVVESGTVDYFLTNNKIVYDAVHKYDGVLTTTSRGSSASFITNKLLGFTTIDRFNSEIPIYPERFLTKERVLSGQMPDIDFNIAKQEPFIEATRNLLGEHSCYPLLAIGKLKAKASWQLYAGANNVEFETANNISKAIEEYNEKVKYADEEDKEQINIEDFIPKEYIDLYRKSLEYQGITIGAKAHACGYLILDKDIRREIGLIRMKSESTGKSVMCVAMEGAYLDKYGYVKNDFLIVDSVDLTNKFFKSINQEVPSFDELREMIRDDKPTWDIYAKGITCCINQCEKPSTTKKAMKYKMTNLAESSAFIAGIRPGFRSLVNGFLRREEYTTGVPQLDELLSDSFKYLLYQESIMKLLAYLGLPMGECYGVIKSISKKKYIKHPEQLIELKDTLKKGWIEKIGDLDKFETTWETVENFALYGFNAPHALSMGGDSAYEAWFKAHHTSKFYEVAINHYQEKDKKDKVKELTKEAVKFFGYKLGNYKFGKDNRHVTVDDNEKTIYPSLSNIKGFGIKVAETLYLLGKDNTMKNFIEILDLLNGQGINKSVLTTLIYLDYFCDFGKTKKLLDTYNLYQNLNGKKQIKKDKLNELGLTENLVKKYSQKETEKIFKDIDIQALLSDVSNNIENKNVPLQDKVSVEIEYLGYPITKLKTKGFYYVTKIDEYKNSKSITRYLTMYDLQTDEQVKYKLSDFRLFSENPIKENKLIKILEESKKPKKYKDDNGKWQTKADEFNFCIDSWICY